MYYQNNNGSQGSLQLNKQRTTGAVKKDFRESYMYLNQFNNGSNMNLHQQTQNGNNSPQQTLQRRFSGQNGGVVGSPMSMTNEEAARKISFNNLIGNTSINNSNLNDDDIMNTLDYMNNMDNNNNNNNNNEWEYIDEEGDDDDNDDNENDDDDDDNDELAEENLTPIEMRKMIDRMKFENRGLKKKLKDIELGHDASSIVANDEKYIKLEDEFTDLASKYLIIENEVKNMNKQNESYFKDITNLRSELHQSEENVAKFNALSKNIIEKLPNFVNQKDNFLILMGNIDLIPESIKDSYQISLKKYNELITNKNIQNSTDGNLTDEDIMKLLKDEVKQLNEALIRQDKLLKHKDKVYNQKIQEERKTIIVSSLQKSLRYEFINQDPNNKRFGLKNFKILKICPDDKNSNDDLNIEPILESSSPLLIPTSSPLPDYTSPTMTNSNMNSSSSTASLTPNHSESRMPYLSPISMPSSSDSSPKKRSTIYSNSDRISQEDDYRDAFSTISKATQNSLVNRNSMATHNSLDIEYETFTN
ncbi:hypothetical protein C6P42_003124 [Pichia californica]|nr:hypothetical protein C6P42_003124 [[Candida] californica]